jgi:hypothetical protein
MLDRFEVEVREVADTQRTFSNTITILEAVGFKILSCDQNRAELQGPGMNSTKQNPLLGATTIQVRRSDSGIKLDATLGGIATMERFLKWFPLGLGLLLGTLFAFVGGMGFGQQFGIPFGVPWAQGLNWIIVAYTFALLPITPWFFISPWMVNMIRRRTTEALKTLLHNAVMKAKLP